jgi:hypothetical protein
MAIVNTTHKQAVKAALALLVATRDRDPRYAAQGVAESAAKLGLQIGDMGNLSALTRYAYGVQEQGEHASNRRWPEYASAVQQLASKLANSTDAMTAAFVGAD